MRKKIAIIIPAYKSRFLQQTLASIAAQTNNSFTVYIGDDASPHDLKNIVCLYHDKLDIVYHCFEENLGKQDLPGHWERCIAMSKEPIVWLFSDDDLMPCDGIERILKVLDKCGERNIMLRFPLALIDGENNVIYENSPFTDEMISGYNFLLDKLEGRIYSAACEYVFSRDVYQKVGGFVRFPLAWCSDDATWTKFADCAKGIMTLPGKPVCWRNVEGENISNSNCYDSRKIESTGLFIKWIVNYYPDKLKEKRLRHALKTYVHTVLHYSVHDNFSLGELWRICSFLWAVHPSTALSVAFRMCKVKLNKKR